MRGRLISSGAQADLDRSDAARAKARAALGTDPGAAFRHNFAKSIAAELEMVRKHGVSAETKMEGGVEVVTKSVAKVAAEKKPWLFRWLRIKNAVVFFFRALFRKDR
jgi:hypothetical protein